LLDVPRLLLKLGVAELGTTLEALVSKVSE
jgi:hypothetical protein